MDALDLITLERNKDPDIRSSSLLSSDEPLSSQEGVFPQ